MRRFGRWFGSMWRDPFRRFKFWVGAALIVLSLGTGFNLWVQQQETHARCVQNRERAIQTSKALATLVEAHTADGSTHAAEAWRSFRSVSAANPPAHC